jgi:Fe-S-cluster containining protein
MDLPAELEQQVVQLFAQMDRDYERVARQAGFACRGCDENCCRTLFHHHTLVELLYLRAGLRALPRPERQRMLREARAADRRIAARAQDGAAVRVMCPLNHQGRCGLYAHRPMICRLHGIPHGLHRPDGRAVTGPGCDAFYAQCGRGRSARLDRTPLYTAMAGLERRLRERLGYTSKIKLTVAQMVISL